MSRCTRVTPHLCEMGRHSAAADTGHALGHLALIAAFVVLVVLVWGMALIGLATVLGWVP